MLNGKKTDLTEDEERVDSIIRRVVKLDPVFGFKNTELAAKEICHVLTELRCAECHALFGNPDDDVDSLGLEMDGPSMSEH